MEIEMVERSQWVDNVNDFLDKFHQDRKSIPAWPSDEVCDLRRKLIAEEYAELTDAWMRRDLPETVDAIIDLCYVLIGALPALGVEADPIWDAVHAANMAKAGGGKNENGKIQKPEGWTPPDIAALLRQQADDAHKQGVVDAMQRFWEVQK